MLDKSRQPPSLVIAAHETAIEVTTEGRLVRFVDASPLLIKTARRSAAFPILRECLHDLALSGLWPMNENELNFPATILEGVFRKARLLEAA